MEEADILARTLYGEARGEYSHTGVSSLIAIANVVINRLREKTWYGKTIGEICQKPYQFSCWSKEDPNYPLIQQKTINDKIFNICGEVARATLQGEWPDLTHSSNHYHALYKIPTWVGDKKPRVTLGRHLFYKL